MQYASADQVRDILIEQFGVDIRESEVDGRKFSVTFEDDEPIIICEWTNLPEGHTVNGSNLYWVRVWAREDGEMPEEYKTLVESFR